MNPRAVLFHVVSPSVNAYEQKQPDYVYKVSVPSPRLETEVVAPREM